ncbi:MAG: flavin reductase family protein, partial [Deltaproteobacteria bacterium]|nr:flavin reductase family protein [Deltaproteobacteria bacterium]
EKFDGIAYKTGECNVPLLEGAMGYIECKLLSGYDGGDHTIYVGEVLDAMASGERPLLFFKGKYYRLPKE